MIAAPLLWRPLPSGRCSLLLPLQRRPRAGCARLAGQSLQLRALSAAGKLARPLQVVRPQLVALLQVAALNIDLAADKLCRERPAHDGAVALGLLR